MQVYSVMQIFADWFVNKYILKVCESFAIDYHSIVNAINSKCICYIADSSMCCPIYHNNQPIPVENRDMRLGNFIFSYIQDKNVIIIIIMCFLSKK